MLCIEENRMIRVNPCLVVLYDYCGAAWQPSRRLLDLLHVGRSHPLMDIHFTTLLKHGRIHGSTACVLICLPLPACLCSPTIRISGLATSLETRPSGEFRRT